SWKIRGSVVDVGERRACPCPAASARPRPRRGPAAAGRARKIQAIFATFRSSRMQKRLSLPVALVLISGAAANAQSLSSGFLGNTVVNSTGSNHGMMFNVTALNPGGITIDSFDIHSREAAGVAITVN